MTRILITGASSYLGMKLSSRLLSDGYEVHIVIRPGTLLRRLPAQIPDSQTHMHTGAAESLYSIVAAAKPDIVYHLASYYTREPKAAELDPMLVSNFSFGVQLLEALCELRHPVRIVSAATHAQYFDSTEPRPLNFYAACKQSFQKMLDYYSDAHGFESVSLVLFDTYGNGDWRLKFLPAAIKAALSGKALAMPDGDLALDLVHIDDVVNAFAHAGKAKLNDRIYAVSSDKTCKLSEIVGLVEQATGKRIIIDKGAYPLPDRRIEMPWRGPTLPGWSSKISLAAGIKSMIEELL